MSLTQPQRHFFEVGHFFFRERERGELLSLLARSRSNSLFRCAPLRAGPCRSPRTALSSRRLPLLTLLQQLEEQQQK